MKKITILLLLGFIKLVGQVNITTGTYFQNFGTANITSWTNNVTFLGFHHFRISLIGSTD